MAAKTTKPVMKATAKGTCQACGMIRKLPNGLIVKHGFSVMNGSQDGRQCEGSFQLPLEQSWAMLPALIVAKTESVAAQQAILATNAVCLELLYVAQLKQFSALGQRQIAQWVEILNNWEPTELYSIDS